MSWPIGALDRLPLKVTATLDGTILLGPAPVTQRKGWVQVRIGTGSGGSTRPVEVSVRLRLSVDAAARPFLYAEEVDFEGRRFAGMHAAAQVLGEPMVSRVVAQVLSKFTHFAIRRTDRHTPISETRVVAQQEPSLGADDTWGPGTKRLSAQRSG